MLTVKLTVIKQIIDDIDFNSIFKSALSKINPKFGIIGNAAI